MGHARPFRFRLFAENFGTASDIIDKARAAEDAGYATFLMRDHFIAEPFGHQFAPMTTLAVVAGATKTLRVGTLVIDNDYRHPAMLAKEAATLDLLSGGRFELGLGAGWASAEYEQMGLPFDPAGERIDRLEESLKVLKGLFSEQPLTHAGRYYQITNLEGFPKPVQRPHPPILLGAGGKRMISMAARHADIIGIMGAPIADGVIVDDPTRRMASWMARQIEWIREAAGERFPTLELSLVLTVIITDDRRMAAERFALERGWNETAVDDVLEMPSIAIGSVDQIVDQLHERRERFNLSYFVINDHSLGPASRVVSRLVGR